MTVDLTESIAPKSDQLNAEDLLTGPRTVQIKEVTKGSAEQPFDFHLVEFPGRPFRPSKTVRRIIVNAWGKESSAYAGRRMTLYRDPEITFGRDKVGGIRISHMSHITKPETVMLTVTRGKRAPHTVNPLPDAPPTITAEQANEIAASIENAANRGDLDGIGAQLKAFDLADHRGRLIELWKSRLAELDAASNPGAKPEPEQVTEPAPAGPTPITAQQQKALFAALRTEGLAGSHEQLEWLTTSLHRQIDSLAHVTSAEAGELIEYLQAEQAKDGAK